MSHILLITGLEAMVYSNIISIKVSTDLLMVLLVLNHA